MIAPSNRLVTELVTQLSAPPPSLAHLSLEPVAERRSTGTERQHNANVFPPFPASTSLPKLSRSQELVRSDLDTPALACVGGARIGHMTLGQRSHNSRPN